MATSKKTRSSAKAPSKAKAKAQRAKASVTRSNAKAAAENARAAKAGRKADSSRAAFDKRNKEARKKALARGAKAYPDGTVRFPKAKASKASRKGNGAGGGKALSDFGNAAKLRLLKPKEIPARRACFKTGQTVSANLAAQKAKGFRGRRKFIRAQVAQGRVSLS